MQARRQRTWTAAALLSLGSSIGLAAPAGGAIDKTNGPIVFESGLPPALGIGSANPDGTNREGVVTATFVDQDPAASFGGTRLAFTRVQDENEEIYTRNLEGGGLARRTEDPLHDYDPAWEQSDRNRIAWSKAGDIWVMDADGENARQLTGGPDIDEQPSWEPGGDEIVFARAGAGLLTVNVRTGAQTPLPQFGAAARDPVFGPGGALLYTAPGSLGVLQVYRGATELTETPGDKEAPVVSPDTTRIAFVAGSDIHVVTADDGTAVGSIDDAADPTWGRAPKPEDGRPAPGNTFILRPLGENDTELQPGVRTVPEDGPPPTLLRTPVEVEPVVGLSVPTEVQVQARIAGGGPSELTLRDGDFSVIQQSPAEAPVVTFRGSPALDACLEYPRAGSAQYGRAHGGSRMRGGWASGGTRGTVWTLEETCTGTIFTVIEGVIEVNADIDRFDRAEVRPEDSPYRIPHPE